MWPTTTWARSTPARQGLDAAPLEELHRAVQSGRYGNTDRLVVIRHGYVVVDHDYGLDYREISRGYRGPLGCGYEACDASWMHDFNYYHPDYHPYYQGRSVHSLQSVTKSISATTLGVVIQNGALAGLDAPLLSFFGDYDLSSIDPRLRAATLRDLLTMRSGIEWHESDRPLDASNTTIQLERSEDWIQFTLDQPMDTDPGEKWAYNSGGSQLMSGIVREVTGEHMDAYAQRHLFAPLGIEDFYWKKTPRGYPDALGGLYLEALDLAKIGYLYLNDGVWAGRRILPPGWVDQATQRHVAAVNQAGWGYGYQWWRPDRGGVDVWAGLGFGG
jgi:CubicO group peptidase (beta-lactamase class C family)